MLSWGWAQELQRSIATRRQISEPGRSEGRSKSRRLPPSDDTSGVSVEGKGPTPRILYGSVHLSTSPALITVASVFAFMPWRTVESELYTDAQPPTATWEARSSTSVRAEFRRFTGETVRVWRLGKNVVCALFRPVARSQ